MTVRSYDRKVKLALRTARASLLNGDVPVLRSFIPGMDKLIKEFGLIPGLDVYVPDMSYNNIAQEQRTRIRNAWRRNHQYRLAREANGEHYESRIDRLRRLADERVNMMLENKKLTELDNGD